MNSQTEKSFWNHRLLTKLWELDFLPEKPGAQTAPGTAARSNLLFALSGMCWFFLYYRPGAKGNVIWFAMVLALYAVDHLSPAFHRGIELPLWGKLLAGLNALGAMGAGVRVSMDWLAAAAGAAEIASLVGVSPKLAAAGVSAVFGLAGFWFLYVLIARVYTALVPVLHRVFADCRRFERLALAALVVALAVFTALSFSASEAFYATSHNYDVIYTADSAYLVKGNTWLNLTFAENDLRQPLFAVFAMPFVGAAYVLTQLVPSGHWLAPWLLNLPQMGLLVLSFYMLSRLMRPDSSAGRVAVTVSLCALYPSLLFSLMMEQYILAVFWLLLFVYMAVEELPGRGGVLVAAAGSLLTSAAMLPMLWRRNAAKPVRRWLEQALAAALLGAFLIVAFLRLDVVLNLMDSVEQLSSFTGENVPLGGRLGQYTAFVAGCFVSPAAAETATLGYPSWQLLPVEDIRLACIALLLLCILGLIVGRRNRLVQISGWWCAFSAILLVGLGWGTAENGLILYGLYFSWAFYVLLRQALVWPLEQAKLTRWQTGLDAVLAAVLLGLNVPGMAALLRFAVSNYPV